MSKHSTRHARFLLSSYLRDGGWHTEANNVLEGVDLDSYENELSLIDWLLRHVPAMANQNAVPKYSYSADGKTVTLLNSEDAPYYGDKHLNGGW